MIKHGDATELLHSLSLVSIILEGAKHTPFVIFLFTRRKKTVTIFYSPFLFCFPLIQHVNTLTPNTAMKVKYVRRQCFNLPCGKHMHRTTHMEAQQLPHKKVVQYSKPFGEWKLEQQISTRNGLWKKLFLKNFRSPQIQPYTATWCRRCTDFAPSLAEVHKYSIQDCYFWCLTFLK